MKLRTILGVLFNNHDGTRAALSNRGVSAAAIFPVFGNIHTGPPESKINVVPPELYLSSS